MTPPLLLLIGPSGTGKTSVVAELIRRNLLAVTPTWTTRPRRPDEAAGCVNHRFVTNEEFRAREAAGFFLGTTTLFGLAHRYGLPPIDDPGDGRVSAVVARAGLVGTITAHHPTAVVWQIEAPAERVVATLRARRCPAAELDGRLRDLDAEIEAGRGRADRVFVNDRPLPTTVAAMTDALAQLTAGAVVA